MKDTTREEAKKRIEKLKKVINHHRYFYHVLDKQEISESALDSLKKELFDLEQKYPELITPDSPTQRIAGKPLKKFEKVRHPQPMLSFNDAFSKKDMTEWQDRISKLLMPEECSHLDFYCELKIDGLAVELIYENSPSPLGHRGRRKIFKTGSTRGDSLIGENVTQNLKTIEAIPLRLRDKEEAINELEKEGLKETVKEIFKEGFKKIVVRGEVFIPRKELERINKEQRKKGLPVFANPRNMAAGSIRQLESQITAQRRLDSFIYDLVGDLDGRTHEEKHKILKCLGFKTNPYNKYCRNLKEVFEFHNYWQSRREKLPYEIDGIVVIVNSNKIYTKLGIVGKAPRAAIAFKFPLKEATTVVEDIRIQVGRTGALTPVAYLKPVKIGGATISRATLHNEDEIKKLGVKIGDTVIIGRAGDVIPDVVKVLSGLRTGKEREFKFPQNCPACNGKVIRKEKKAVWRCINPKCFARQREYFCHFVSRRAFDIVGLGPKIIDKLLEVGLISDPADLFKLEVGDIIPLERFDEKSAKNLIEAIQSKKKITLSRFIYALGIRNVGQETAQNLAEILGSLEKLEKASSEKLQAIMDIGPIVAESIYDYFKNKKNLEFLEKLEKAEIEIKSLKFKVSRKSGIPSEAGQSSKLKGLIFVLTGNLESMAREEAKEKIRLLGDKVSESISKKTDYLVVGREPGSKLERAKRLGVKIINEREFISMLK